MNIGRLVLPSRLLAAPMAGVIDVSMRILLIQYGAGMVFSEMVSAEGIRRNQRGSTTLVTCLPEESPCGVQLFGRDPSALADAARYAEDHGAALVDINMGCPVKKVVRQGAGAALLMEPGLCGQIVESVARAVRLPVTAKIRAGWDTSAINYREVGERLADAGADAVILHPRTAVQFFSGAADWSLVTDLAGRLPIPVIGSGDIGGYRQAQERMSETGAAFVMIGRAAMGRPWVFSPEATGPGTGRSLLYYRASPAAHRTALSAAKGGLGPEAALYLLHTGFGRCGVNKGGPDEQADHGVNHGADERLPRERLTEYTCNRFSNPTPTNRQ